MSAFVQIVRYQMRDVLRSRWIPGYAIILFALTESLFFFGDGSGEHVLVSLTNVVLLLAPLVGIAFGTLYLYGSRDFNELLLAQPVGRATLYAGLYTGLTFPLCLAFVLGIGLPFALHTGTGAAGSAAALLGVGVLLTMAFTAVAFLIAVRLEERVHGMGVSVAVWLMAAVLYDGFVLVMASAFSSYPLEKAMIGFTLMNPVDLGRVLLLMQFDVSALMGYTGAVFERFFGSGLGIAISAGALMLWAAGPLAFGLRLFNRKDF